ncbi:Lmo0850 family protein [Heyndrickxia ginsengihumi]|nr:Lmo0850 family protein [Heyndrickxia ginsengihumi]MCM3022127.1 Lmo0850 family protein [Heyndrickxia ginsengihumi]
MKKNHDHLKKVISSFSAMGIKTSYTKSRLELIEILENCKYITAALKK